MKRVGSVEIPQEAFLAVLRIERAAKTRRSIRGRRCADVAPRCTDLPAVIAPAGRCCASTRALRCRRVRRRGGARRLRTWLRRLSWYGVGFVADPGRLLPLPAAADVLHLQIGDRSEAILLTASLFGRSGGAYAFAYAWWRFRGCGCRRRAAIRAALLNAIATAFIDEATFRGILLGLLLVTGWPDRSRSRSRPSCTPWRRGSVRPARSLHARPDPRGRPRRRLATVVTGGIGAAFLGHCAHAVRRLRRHRPPGPGAAPRHGARRRSRAGSDRRTAGAWSGTGDAVYGGR